MPLYQAAFIAQAFEALARELDCRSAIRQAQLQCESLETTRAWAIDLAVRCAHAAVTVSSGAANKRHDAAQGLSRGSGLHCLRANHCAYGATCQVSAF